MRTFNEWALDRCDEGFFDSLKKGYGQGYQQARQGVEQNYDRYADAARQALSKAGGVAKTLSQKTGVPLPLATALLAAGITGGPTAVPFAALLYFVKQPLMKGANKAFDATWDTGAKVAGRVGQAVAPAQAPKPAFESFRAFVEADTWGDWAGEKAGGAAGRVAGNVSGYGQKIAGTLGQRASEIGQWAKGNPKEVARMLFLVGAGAVIGAGVGKLTHDVKDMIVQKIRDYGIPKEELDWLRQNLVIEKGKDGSYGTGEVVLQTGDKDTYDAASKAGETQGAYVAGQTVVSSDRMALDGATSRNDAGGFGYVATDVTPGEFTGRAATGVPNQDIGDAYRDIAVAMRGGPGQSQQPSTLSGWARHLVGGERAPEGSFVQNLKGLNPNPQDAVDQFGHSAASEIKRRLASPDAYTNPAAVAGGIVGGTGNRRRNR